MSILVTLAKSWLHDARLVKATHIATAKAV